jgi:TolA-binding protein
MKRSIKILVAAVLFSAFFAQAEDAAAGSSNNGAVRELKAVLMLIEKDQPAEAARALAAVNSPDAEAPAMTEFVRGRLSLAEKKYPEALQHFSNVIVFHSRDPEWMPAATFYEGAVYKRTGYTEAAANIAEELEMAYPDTVWSRRAAELK